MTSDGFVAFWRSVQSSPSFKSSYFGPVLELNMGLKRGCAEFWANLPSQFRIMFPNLFLFI